MRIAVGAGAAYDLFLTRTLKHANPLGGDTCRIRVGPVGISDCARQLASLLRRRTKFYGQRRRVERVETSIS